MLLETLDLRTNDILIYSQNKFNFNDNFKIIYKNEKIKRAFPINYLDVCSYVKDPSPKNLIIYRMLTNVDHLDAYSSKYGYFIKINNKMELVYFDPIFAVKDLRHLRFNLDPNYFRFKIQQVGLTSLTKKDNEANFAEVYSFDLKADEAQNQNDKIFADAIFAFDPGYSDNENHDEEEFDKALREKINYSIEKEDSRQVITDLSNIAEDKTSNDSSKSNLILPAVNDANKAQLVREEIISLLKQVLSIDEKKITANKNLTDDLSSTDSKKINEQKINNKNEIKNILELFKSTRKSDDLSLREKRQVILKFTKS
ncbi:hypothetical protein ABRY23_09265 [Melioribacteraceae bacterium 4301-Me]|uniref:hypothetical protein n=1 Tax=Pyranulibacter aquaticus TaxID=3163344 RepID=UPI003596859E